MFQSGCLSRLKAAATPSIMLPYLLLSSASFALPIPIIKINHSLGVRRLQRKSDCVKVEGHENVDQSQGTELLGKSITARVCFGPKSLIFRVEKPADLVDGGQMFLQAPTEEAGVIMDCNRPRRFLVFRSKKSVCKREYDHVTAGNYELNYNGRKIVFEVAPPGNPEPLLQLAL